MTVSNADEWEKARAAVHEFSLIAVGPRASDFWPLLQLWPLKAFVVCEGGENTSAIAYKSQIISLESESCVRLKWGNLDVASLIRPARPLINDMLSRGERIMVMAYSSTVEWAELERYNEGNIYVLASSPYHKMRIDDKIYTRNKLVSRGISVPRCLALFQMEPNYQDLSSSLGSPVVLQSAEGSAGSGTYLIHSQDELDSVLILNQHSRWLASKHCGDLVLNLHGLVSPDGCEVSPPSIQLTGIAELQVEWGGYCGNDFLAALALPESTLNRARTLS